MRIKHLGRKLLSLVLSATLAIPLSVTAFAMSNGNGTGDNNTDLTGGTSSDYWNGKSGVRVTIMSTSTGKRVSVPIDYTEDNPTVDISFGMNCKSDYVKNGTSLAEDYSTYKWKTPTIPFGFNVIPVSDDDPKFKGNNVKDYFCKEGVLKNVVDDINANEHLTGSNAWTVDKIKNSGDYRLLLEPVAYFVYGGVSYAATATEIALLDEKMNGDVKAKLRPFTHLSIPECMYLERDDNQLGYAAPHNRVQMFRSDPNGKPYYTDDYIKNKLGMNIVSYIDAISWERLGVNVYNHLYITTRQPNDGYTVDDLKDTTLEYQLAHSHPVADENGNDGWHSQAAYMDISTKNSYVTTWGGDYVFAPHLDTSYTTKSNYYLIGMERVLENSTKVKQYPSTWGTYDNDGNKISMKADGNSIWPYQNKDIIQSGGTDPTTVVDIFTLSTGGKVYETIKNGYDIHTAYYKIDWVENYSSPVYAHTYTSTRQLPVGVTKSTALHKRRKKS